jgi:hypothetical protein
MRLASRLREEGLTVYGFGEEKTPRPFVAACDKFVYIELLREDALTPTNGEPASDPAISTDAAKPAAAEPPKKPKAPVGFIAKILDDSRSPRVVSPELTRRGNFKIVALTREACRPSPPNVSQ